MNSSTLNDRLAVCSWSLLPANPRDLAAKLRAVEINRIQLALDPLRENPAIWGAAATELPRAGITIVSGMFGCVGEDYSTLDSIRMTGGIVPDITWPQNLKNIQATAGLAAELGLKLVTFHAGFVHHEPTTPDYQKMLSRLAVVAEIFADRHVQLGLETGQESAAALARLLAGLDHPNVGVNFDPANMVLYAQGDPVAAVRTLGPLIRQVHIKDAKRTQVPGTWGEEVVAGNGEVDWQAFLKALKEINFAGDIVIEREAGTQRVADVRTAREILAKLIP
jgi:sugar phosphate isomerase/epimerase